MTVSLPTLDDVLHTAQRTALHLEMRDSYGGTTRGFAEWLAGEPYDNSEDDAAWHSILRPLVNRNVDIRRARIISEPLSDYIRFEYSTTPAANLQAGERVRWLPRRQASDLALPGNDFWLVDHRVVFNHFSGDGDWIDSELVDSPAVVTLCALAFELVWERGVDHADYQPS